MSNECADGLLGGALLYAEERMVTTCFREGNLVSKSIALLDGAGARIYQSE